ncbi:hypothetical protein ABZ215_10590 [Amycolatopsis sp. NPDC006131]|uniref:hypothetical protein n=1 Tax=Amycolatopsis sp. NPDC006131 TaxID=3156731 RepID=UPI0033BC4C0D
MRRWLLLVLLVLVFGFLGVALPSLRAGHFAVSWVALTAIPVVVVVYFTVFGGSRQPPEGEDR